jgi:hypothetical protein
MAARDATDPAQAGSRRGIAFGRTGLFQIALVAL